MIDFELPDLKLIVLRSEKSFYPCWNIKIYI